ncbi:hypothetical protein BGZ65_003515 [Modicella reniformis]|uniref:Uncharacterized protein n=1 Tax=Modicella reniformis TaxID=1440133 RepID=A0A9P6LTW7_9FUNG|nr:hypothetical protein BGZ65_003515 [Modicella reniformis]
MSIGRSNELTTFKKSDILAYLDLESPRQLLVVSITTKNDYFEGIPFQGIMRNAEIVRKNKIGLTETQETPEERLFSVQQSIRQYIQHQKCGGEVSAQDFQHAITAFVRIHLDKVASRLSPGISLQLTAKVRGYSGAEAGSVLAASDHGFTPDVDLRKKAKARRLRSRNMDNNARYSLPSECLTSRQHSATQSYLAQFGQDPAVAERTGQGSKDLKKKNKHPTQSILETICSRKEADTMVLQDYGSLLKLLFVGDKDQIREDKNKAQTSYGHGPR